MENVAVFYEGRGEPPNGVIISNCTERKKRTDKVSEREVNLVETQNKKSKSVNLGEKSKSLSAKLITAGTNKKIKTKAVNTK